MKTTRSPLTLATAALGAALLLAAGSAFAADSNAAAPAKSPEPEVTVTAAETWSTIKDYTYDQRADFAVGVGHMLERLDIGIARLKAKRATLPQTSVKDWDFAMKELTEASSALRSQLNGLDKATPETWNETKDRLAQAWQRARDAYDKVRTSTTA